MKVFRKLTWSMVFALCMGAFVACSDDDGDGNGGGGTDKINPSAVFTGGFPESVSGMSLTYSSDGYLTKIEDDYETVTFDYDRLRMTIKDEYEGTFTYLDMTIGSNGFVKSCKQTYSDDNDVDTWEFGYTSDGYLNYMKRSEGEETTNITYENGNITKVTMDSKEEDYALEALICYVSDNTQTAIDNKACLMLFDATFEVDMDEMNYAYWAGLLGKATQHLPVKMLRSDDDGTETMEFKWTLNENGYPVKMTSSEEGEYYFSW